MNEQMIQFDRARLLRLKREYQKQRRAGKTEKDVFKFDGHDLAVGYAKYLIEYLESRFAKEVA